MTLDNMTGITNGSYTGFCKSQLITCNRVKECNGVCPFEDALKHADKTQTMNDQHTVDHDRDWIIGCIEHDGFIHTDRFDKANQIIHDALSAEAEWIPCSERLPEIDETLRLCDQISEEVIGTDTYGNIRHVYLTKCGYLNPTFCTVEEGMSVNIVAWMPLPKPYKGGGK